VLALIVALGGGQEGGVSEGGGNAGSAALRCSSKASRAAWMRSLSAHSDTASRGTLASKGGHDGDKGGEEVPVSERI